MARVKKVMKSRAEYKCGKCGKVIPVGSPYQSIKFAYRPIVIHCNDCGFERSETVSSEYLQWLYDKQDNLSIDSADDVDMLISELQDMADELRSRLDNMPEGLQQGDAGQILETRADSLEEAVQSLQDLDNFPTDTDDLGEIQGDDESEEDFQDRLDDLLEEKQEELRQEIDEIVGSIEE